MGAESAFKFRRSWSAAGEAGAGAAVDAFDSGSGDSVLAGVSSFRPRNVGRPRGAIPPAGAVARARLNEGRRTARRGLEVTEAAAEEGGVVGESTGEVDPDWLDEASVDATDPRVRGANPRRTPPKAALPANRRVVAINPTEEVVELVAGATVLLAESELEAKSVS